MKKTSGVNVPYSMSRTPVEYSRFFSFSCILYISVDKRCCKVSFCSPHNLQMFIVININFVTNIVVVVIIIILSSSTDVSWSFSVF